MHSVNSRNAGGGNTYQDDEEDEEAMQLLLDDMPLAGEDEWDEEAELELEMDGSDLDDLDMQLMEDADASPKLIWTTECGTMVCCMLFCCIAGYFFVKFPLYLMVFVLSVSALAALYAHFFRMPDPKWVDKMKVTTTRMWEQQKTHLKRTISAENFKYSFSSVVQGKFAAAGSKV